MKKQEMSIDDLAVMINKSFNHVEERLDSLEQGQKEIKQELTFTARKFEVTDLTSRVEKLEYKMAKMTK